MTHTLTHDHVKTHIEGSGIALDVAPSAGTHLDGL